MTFDKREFFQTPSASSIRDEAFSCFGIGGVHQNPGNKKGGFSRPLKF
jgi:hypothetical protein